MRRWLLLGLPLLAGAGCTRAPGESRSLDRPGEVATTVAAAPAAKPGDELGTEPALGARKPPPPLPGARDPLPPPTPAATADPSMVAGTPSPPLPTGEAPGSGVSAATPGTPADPAGPEPNVPPGDTPVEILEVPGMDQTPPNAPPPAPETGAAPEILAGGAVTLNRFVICRDVKDREPVGPANSFPREREGQVWVYLDAANAGAASQSVTVHFESVDRPGSAPPAVRLEIGPGPRYRTWARASTWRPSGTYRVVVRDEAGTPLARGTFQIVEL
ncbi:MAG: DUF2914 domain-containing protein [Deltaproteobacteria bacterium]|nr:DUF2914 domain-containing protein [Deltaproteobacteria bacterium]